MNVLAPALLVTALALAIPAGFAADAMPPAGGHPSASDAPASDQASPPFMAVVSGTVIGSAEYETAANEAARQKFFHGKPPEGAVEALLREVADDLINRVLLLDEAKRRKLKADAKAVDEKIDQYERRYASSPRWQQERGKILPGLRERLEQDSILGALEAAARKTPVPAENEVRAYYKANPDKFTEPAKMRVSLILLKVDPSSTTDTWKAAEAEATAIEKKLRAGADFAELAKLHSADPSAEQGGDLGYLHLGMLPDGIQEKIDGMKPGEVSSATRILEGYVVFRYEALQAPKHHNFETVRQRASDLLARDQSEEAWKSFIAGLRKKAKISINTERYPMLATAAAASR